MVPLLVRPVSHGDTRTHAATRGAEVRDPDVSRATVDAIATIRFATGIDLSGGQVPGLAYAFTLGDCPTREERAAAVGGGS